MLITNMIVTAYLATGHLAADGHKPVAGVTCAGPRSLPFGTKIEVAGWTWIITDRTARRFDGRCDLFFGTDRKAAINFGKQRLSVKITTP